VTNRGFNILGLPVWGGSVTFDTDRAWNFHIDEESIGDSDFYTVSLHEGGHVLVEPTGKVQVATGLGTQGQGHQTVFAQIVADELGVDVNDVEVVTGDTRRFPYAVGTFASRAAVMSGNAIHLAARKVREKALTMASEALEVDEEDLELAEGQVRVIGSPDTAIPLKMLATLSNPMRYAFDEQSAAATQFATPADPNKPPVADDQEPGLEGTDYYSPLRSTFANGMHAVEVEVDPDTSDIKILRYAVVHDCGKLLNPMIVKGQVLGGVAQGVGGALYEKMAYDEHGQLQNASFMDFLMPYATEVPAVDIAHLETPSPLNPLGIKGAGEAGVIPGSAAIAAAIEDATGVTISAMPIGPSELHERRLRAAEEGSAA
jgi:CO/xanthine dehydrogenase Mo-binding subunit